jgi:deoxycytidylate deaminase
MSDADATRLMDRDRDEQLDWGQRVADAFHLADIFVRLDESHDRLRRDLGRIVELLFGHPFVTPTFDEYAMFLAFAASLRSADLSRQVGAVIAVDEQIVATGANDCPRADGGLYWPVTVGKEGVYDVANGRDYMRGEDSNRVEQQHIIDDIVERTGFSGAEEERLRRALAGSRIRDLTEFGRVVHAEMEAILSCARVRVPVKGGDLFSTTFPCHNCAKHIVAAGIRRVVFIEPYPKSKALEFHDDSIVLAGAEASIEPACATSARVRFEPFVGVGPRRFVDLFSTRLGSGYPLKRKDQHGRRLPWPAKGRSPDLRLQMLPMSYLELEQAAALEFEDAADALREREERRSQ